MKLEMFRNTAPQESLAEPRFVDEATLLSARPVIPIAALEAKSRLRRHLTLFLAVITSMLFGAAAAVIVIHLERGADAGRAQVESSPAEPHGSSTSPNQADASASTGSNTVSIDSSAAVAADPPDLPRIGRKQTEFSSSRNRHPITPGASVIKRTTEEAPQTERRERRVSDAEHVLRSRRSRTTEDIFRVQEIFEGPSKP